MAFMWNEQTVSVVFPAYNEEGNIKEAVQDFFACGYVDEVIVVDNNSTDLTAARVSETEARLVNESAQGYGYALRRGLTEATGDLIILAEPDGTFMGKDVLKLLTYSDDVDMVCGTRTTRELIWSAANMGWFLRLGNIFAAKLLEVLYSGPSLSDVGCTMRLIRRNALERFRDELEVGGSHFLPEMVVHALKKDVSLLEIPLNYRGRVGDSKITGNLKGTLQTGFNMIWLILKHRFRA